MSTWLCWIRWLFGRNGTWGSPRALPASGYNSPWEGHLVTSPLFAEVLSLANYFNINHPPQAHILGMVYVNETMKFLNLSEIQDLSQEELNSFSW